tara:strand:+ start:3710 stop:4327 length:618 start_codon:yes stop_codon:yes gene_type:complete
MKKKPHLINLALYLSIFTIAYNIIEGLISIYIGYNDETLALLGFGVDSFVEVFSGFGILNLSLLMKFNKKIDFSEKMALKITGFSFYFLTLGLLITSSINILNSHEPVTTKWGIIISLISLSIMWYLIKRKKYVGNELNSAAIIADAKCNIVCMQLSLVLLFSSLFNHYFNIGYFDSIGALVIAYFSFKEGKEAFFKSNNNGSCC